MMQQKANDPVDPLHEQAQKTETSWKSFLVRFFFGNDIFISYSRRDAVNYALELANKLTKQKLTCFVDLWGAPPGVKIPRKLKIMLRRSTMMVLVGTRGAAASSAVKQEIQEFLKTERAIIPINVDGALEQAEWYSLIQGIALATETNLDSQPGAVSEQVISRVVNAKGFISRRKRLLITFWVILAATILLTSFAGVFVWLSAGKAEKQRQIALANELASGAESARAQQDNLLERSVLLGVESITKFEELGLHHSILADQTLRRGLALLPYLKTRIFHEGGVTAAAFSPDGNYLAMAETKDDTTVIKIWRWNKGSMDTQPLKAANTSIAAGEEILSMTLSAGGKQVAVAYTDNVISSSPTMLIQVWDTASWQPLDHPLANSDTKNAIMQAVEAINPEDPNHDNLAAITFSPGGEYLIVATGKEVRMWKPDGKTDFSPDIARMAYNKNVFNVSFSSDNKYLITVNNDGSLQKELWRQKDLKEEACRRLTRNLTRNEWAQFKGGEPYRNTCANLPTPAVETSPVQ